MARATAPGATWPTLTTGSGWQAIPRPGTRGVSRSARADDSPLRRGRALVAGDAGTAQPWTREGISFALRSGALAGAAAAAAAAAPDPQRLDRALDAYPEAVGEVLPDGRRARLLTAFSRHPGAFHARPRHGQGLAGLCPVLPQ